VAQEPDEIRQAIDQTREDIANTLVALGQKADVKARATDKVRSSASAAGQVVAEKLPPEMAPLVDEVSRQARSAGDAVRRQPPSRLLVVAGAVVLLLVWHRHGRRAARLAPPAAGVF
jgi:Protein of unknown function (DUF3618)